MCQEQHSRYSQCSGSTSNGINKFSNSGTNAASPAAEPAASAWKPSIMYGTARTGKDDAVELLAGDVSLVASGVSKDATKDQLKEFIEGKGIAVIEVEKLTRDDAETRTNTFKVVVKLSDYEKAMNPDIWPYRVGVRHYRAPKKQNMSWKSQSQKSGGQVHEEANRTAGKHQGYRGNERNLHNRDRQATPSFRLDVQNRFDPLRDNAYTNKTGETIYFN